MEMPTLFISGVRLFADGCIYFAKLKLDCSTLKRSVSPNS